MSGGADFIQQQELEEQQQWFEETKAIFEEQIVKGKFKEILGGKDDEYERNTEEAKSA